MPPKVVTRGVGDVGMQAIKIEGCPPDSKFAFINDCYEPMQMQHNGAPVWVARAVASRYLFHNGKGRWVISKVMDDGYKCWAFVKATSTTSPESGEQWQTVSGTEEWAPEPRIKCSSVAPSMDQFVKLRMSLDEDMKKYGFIENTDLKKMWRRLDYNGNNVVSLAEIDKFVVELVAGGVFPEWMNNKPALMRAYKKTCLKDGDGDDFVQKHEFHDLLLNIFWFNKCFLIFQQMDSGADRRMDFGEFSAGMAQMGLRLSPQEAQAEFRSIDVNGGGQVLFVEFCAYIRKRVNPDSNPQFDTDILEGEDCTKAHFFTAKQHLMQNQIGQNEQMACMGGSHIMGKQGGKPQATRALDFGGGAGGGDSFAQSTLPHSGQGGGERRGRHETLRSIGPSATVAHQVKPKTFSDFDDLEAKIKASLADPQQIQGMWRLLDFNGNSIVSLAEIDKWAVEQYPLLNHKPALMRCYKCTIASGSQHDDWVHKKDFKMMVTNLFYFNKVYWLYDEANGDDRRMDFGEFKQALALCRMNINEAQAKVEFKKIDLNGGGQILFDEFCHWIASKQCPEGVTEFLDDGSDRTGTDGTAQALAYASGKNYKGTMHY